MFHGLRGIVLCVEQENGAVGCGFKLGNRVPAAEFPNRVRDWGEEIKSFLTQKLIVEI
jgi:hypothetical protein